MDKNNSSSGLGLGGVLTIIFVVLKLVGVIDWSWWWVLSPTLISIGLSLIIIIGYIIYLVIDDKRQGITPNKRRKK